MGSDPRMVNIENPISKRGTIRIDVRNPIPDMVEVVVEEIIRGASTIDALMAFKTWLMDRDQQLSKSRARALAIAVEVVREAVDPGTANTILKEMKRRLTAEGQAA